MILFYSPGACSLADHIALHEAGIKFDLVKVDLTTHKVEDGRPYSEINPTNYVPALLGRRGSPEEGRTYLCSGDPNRSPG